MSKKSKFMPRKASLSDLPELARLFDEYRVFYKQSSDIGSCQQFISERLENQDSMIYVIPQNDQLIAFVQLYLQWSSVSMQQYLVLNDLYVDSEFRDKGLGTALINHSKEVCKINHYKGIQIETERNNDRANYLYPKQGFEPFTTNLYFWMKS